MDIDDVQYTVAQVKAGAYANFKVKQIIVESESSASFVGEISNIAVAFTGLDAVEF